jgi:hypothetical protein
MFNAWYTWLYIVEPCVSCLVVEVDGEELYWSSGSLTPESSEQVFC